MSSSAMWSLCNNKSRPCVAREPQALREAALFTFGALLMSGTPFVDLEEVCGVPFCCREQIQFYQSYIALLLLPFPDRPSCCCLSHISVCCPNKCDLKCAARVSYLALSGAHLLLEQELFLFQRQTVLQQLLLVPQPALLQQQPLHLNTDTCHSRRGGRGGVSGSSLPCGVRGVPGCRGQSASADAASPLRRPPL